MIGARCKWSCKHKIDLHVIVYIKITPFLSWSYVFICWIYPSHCESSSVNILSNIRQFCDLKKKKKRLETTTVDGSRLVLRFYKDRLHLNMMNPSKTCLGMFEWCIWKKKKNHSLGNWWLMTNWFPIKSFELIILVVWLENRAILVQHCCCRQVIVFLCDLCGLDLRERKKHTRMTLSFYFVNKSLVFLGVSAVNRRSSVSGLTWTGFLQSYWGWMNEGGALYSPALS